MPVCYCHFIPKANDAQKTKEKKQGWKNTSYSVITRNTSAGLSTNFKKIIANERLGVRKQGLSDRGRAIAVETKYLSLQFLVSGGGEGNDHLLSCKIMSTTDSTGGGTQMNASFEQFTLSHSLANELHHRSISFSVVHIFLSLTTFLSNSLILVALLKTSPFIRRRNSCIVVWQQLIYQLVLLTSLSMLPS